METKIFGAGRGIQNGALGSQSEAQGFQNEAQGPKKQPRWSKDDTGRVQMERPGVKM